MHICSVQLDLLLDNYAEGCSLPCSNFNDFSQISHMYIDMVYTFLC